MNLLCHYRDGCFSDIVFIIVIAFLCSYQVPHMHYAGYCLLSLHFPSSPPRRAHLAPAHEGLTPCPSEHLFLENAHLCLMHNRSCFHHPLSPIHGKRAPLPASCQLTPWIPASIPPSHALYFWCFAIRDLADLGETDRPGQPIPRVRRGLPERLSQQTNQSRANSPCALLIGPLCC